jgi:Spy/CpxP family protein refolding chaperone
MKESSMLKRISILAASLATVCAMAQTTPYAGQQTRSIKALSTQDVADLQAGQGMGLAKAAELNGYPGPAHVLEHADALGLNDHQRTATQALLTAHKAQARQLGAQLLDRERTLDQAFAARQIDGARLAQLTREIGELQGQLREEHLRTHLTQTALLEPEQIQKYAVLRGYASDSSSTASPQPSPSTHGKHH